MKKALPILLCLIMLVGCEEEEPETSWPQTADGEKIIKRMKKDGQLSLKPGEAVILPTKEMYEAEMAFWNEKDENGVSRAESLANHNRSLKNYGIIPYLPKEALIDGDIYYEGKDETLKRVRMYIDRRGHYPDYVYIYFYGQKDKIEVSIPKYPQKTMLPYDLHYIYYSENISGLIEKGSKVFYK